MQNKFDTKADKSPKPSFIIRQQDEKEATKHKKRPDQILDESLDDEDFDMLSAWDSE
jgi:hypothetical protein